ncbi:MAG: hypothetical protein R3C56_34370 [Pirellulaceae bacterium]
MKTADSKRLIEQLTEFPEPPMLILTGGDPLKRQDIHELVEYAVACGLQVSITQAATPLVTRVTQSAASAMRVFQGWRLVSMGCGCSHARCQSRCRWELRA